MSNSMEEKGLAAHYDTLLEQANGIYLEIEMHYQSMQNNLSASSSLHVMQTVDTLLEEAKGVEGLIADALDETSPMSASTGTLLEKRQAILHRLYQGNRDIATRARNVQSLLRHEMASLSTNHKAINGYKPPGAERKNIIRAAF